jgi:hypothetical protein
VQLSDPDAFYGMKHALCLNAANHDAARGVSQPLCWSCRVPLSASAAAEEERCAARIKQEDDVLFGTDDMRVERSAQASIHRGVSVHWLIHFTNAHDCWSWPTWRVVENIIKVHALALPRALLPSLTRRLRSHPRRTRAAATSTCPPSPPQQKSVGPTSSYPTPGAARGAISSPPPPVSPTYTTARCACGATSSL